MKEEIITKLEELLKSENVLTIQKEFNQLSSKLKSLVNEELKAAQAALENASEKKDEEGEKVVSDSDETNHVAEKMVALVPDVQSEVSPSEPIEEATPDAPKEVSAEDLSDTNHVAEKIVSLVPDVPSDVSPNEPAEEATTDAPKEVSAEDLSDTNHVADKMIDLVPEVSSEVDASETTEETPPSEEVSLEEIAKKTVEVVEKAVTVGKAKLNDAQQKIQDKFEDMSNVFRAKIKLAVEEKNKIEKEAVENARALLLELKELVANEENIGKSFAVFNEVKDKWKALPKVSNDAYRELNADYNKVVEKFFYNINIYKELKELDLKHNLDEKLKVLEDQKKLLEINDVRLLEVEVRLNQDRWNEIGPTFKENWDKLKDEFWNLTRDIYKRIQEFYNIRRGEQDKNLEHKQELLNRVKYIDTLELKAHKKWQEKTKEIIDIQKEWKIIGFVPKEHSSQLWKEFRTTCDHFFEKKRGHYEEIHEGQNKNKEAKQALLTKAEELKENDDWNETTEALIKLQKEWKVIGPAHQRDENKLWRKFREACDEFFQAKKGHKVEETGQQAENLIAKQALVEKLESYATESKTEGIKDLKQFSIDWRNIGHVPFKEKDSVNKAYKKAMDQKYADLKIDQKQKEQIKFEQKVEDLKVGDNSDHLIRKEHDQIRNQLSKLKNEVIQLENNMGFFASSAGADKFKAEIEAKITKAKQEMELLQQRLSVLRKL